MWQETEMIGRDKILENKVYPKINHNTKRFVLRGGPGVGKTALLEWCVRQSGDNVALVSANSTHAQNIKDICCQWGLEVDVEKGQPKTADYENTVLGCEGNIIYIDDLHNASKKSLYMYKILAERHRVCGSMRPVKQMKEDLKQFLWSTETITIPRLPKKDAERLAQKACLHYGSKLSHFDVAKSSRGLPGRIFTFARTGEIQKEEIRLESEEIDISFIFVGLLLGLVALKVLGRAGGGADIALVGGLLTGARLLVMPLMRAGKQ